MQRIFNVLLSSLQYFASLRSQRRDDPTTATHKSLQRAVWAGVFSTVLILMVAAGLASALERFARVELLRASMASFAPVAADMFLVLFGVAMVFTVVSYWRLQRFIRSESAD